MDLNQLREQIDVQDDIILKAFIERMKISSEIAEYKKENDLPIYVGKREKELLLSIGERTPEELRTYSRALFQSIMLLSKAVQHRQLSEGRNSYEKMITEALERSPKMLPADLTIACQGVEGAYSQMAAEKIFQHPHIMYFSTFESVFKAVKTGLCKYGVLPIENSTAGSVNAIYDLMLKYNFSIVRSCRLKIDHCLLVNKGTAFDDIKEVYSHEQALNQCGEFLSSLPKGVKITPVKNTAEAAKLLADSQRKDIAAISSKECAALYNLTLLADSIQNTDNNHTRFICISREPVILPGADRTSIMLTTPHTAGSLYQVMAQINAVGINIEKLESRPLPNKDFEFMFYFDLRTPVYSKDLYDLLLSLESSCDTFRYLGSYSETV